MRSVLRRRLGGTAVTASGLLCSMLVWHSSAAVLHTRVANTGDTFASGIRLSDDHAGKALFAASALLPDATQIRCINVTYTGSAAANITFAVHYAGDDPASPLARYLDFTVDEVPVGAACDPAQTPLAQVTRAGDTLKALTDRTTAHPVQVWTATGRQTRRYRFTYMLQDNPAAQDRRAKVDFIWTAKPREGSPGHA